MKLRLRSDPSADSRVLVDHAFGIENRVQHLATANVLLDIDLGGPEQTVRCPAITDAIDDNQTAAFFIIDISCQSAQRERINASISEPRERFGPMATGLAPQTWPCEPHRMCRFVPIATFLLAIATPAVSGCSGGQAQKGAVATAATVEPEPPPVATTAEPKPPPAATPLTKEQALAILSDRGEKQLGNWINVDRKGGNWHFAATWKSGTAAYYVVDGMTGEILYSNPNTDNEAVPERFQQAEAQASFHIVDHGLKPTVWAESDR